MTTPDWNALRAAEFALPDGADLPAFVDAGFSLLASADPDERDELAYPALATWLETGKLDDTLAQIGDRAAALLGASEAHTRSFAALVLTEVRWCCATLWCGWFHRHICTPGRAPGPGGT